MSVPQKEGPASMLRAMFAGVGSLLSVVDKVRGKTAAENPTDAETPAPAPAAAAPAAAAEPQPAEPETVVAETVTPETVTPETVVAETVVAETVTTETVTPETSAASALPLANYDESSVASLRARLRGLSVASLTELVEYEKGHAGRADVISMFERRIAKVEAEA